MLFGHLYIFSGKKSTEVLWPFFDWDVGVFVVKLQVFIILCIFNLIRYMIYKYFSHSFDCLFTFLTVSFDVRKVLIFIKTNLSNFLLSLVLLLSYMSPLPTPRSWNFNVVISSVLRFQLSHFSSLIHFELMLVDSLG